MSDNLLATKEFNGDLPSTRWSIVRAMGGDATERRKALEIFAEDYWPAVYAFARKKGYAPPDAEDLTQAFLIDLIERESFDELSSQRGRFRSWLLASLHNFLRNDWRSRRSQKRGGSAKIVSIDRDLGEDWVDRVAADDLSPDLIFDRRWAAAVLDRAFAELGRSYEREGKGHVARVLAPMIAGMEARPSFARAAKELEISEPGARMAAFRMRKRLRALVREEVAATVSTPAEVEAELQELYAILAPPGSHDHH